jgi:hypothetical protein
MQDQSGKKETCKTLDNKLKKKKKEQKSEVGRKKQCDTTSHPHTH